MSSTHTKYKIRTLFQFTAADQSIAPRIDCQNSPGAKEDGYSEKKRSFTAKGTQIKIRGKVNVSNG